MSAVVQGGGNAGVESQPLSVAEIESKPLSEVRATLRKQRRALDASQEQSRVESRQSVVASSSDEDGESTSDGARNEGAERTQGEPGSGKQKKQSKPSHVSYEEYEAEKERFNSLSANMKKTADELAAIKKEREEEKKQAENQRRVNEYVATIQEIQRRVPDPEQQKQVIQAYQQQLVLGEQNAFGEHLQTQQSELQKRVDDLNLRETKQKLPALVTSIINHVSEEHGVEADVLTGVTSEPAFVELLDLYEGWRDLAMIGEMLNVFAAYEAKRNAATAEQNRVDAVQEAQATRIPTRVTSGGRNSGRTTSERIEGVPTGMPWREFSKYVKNYGTPSAALAAMKAGK